MAFDGFIQLNGIEGESSDAKYEGWNHEKGDHPWPKLSQFHTATHSPGY
jgi:type VI protein secretion system component Hcp